jgi:hypothetical protein
LSPECPLGDLPPFEQPEVVDDEVDEVQHPVSSVAS